MTQENDYLVKCVRAEQNHLRDLKHLEVKEIEQLTDQLEECQLEKKILEQKYQAVRLEYDKLKGEMKLMTEGKDGDRIRQYVYRYNLKIV